MWVMVMQFQLYCNNSSRPLFPDMKVVYLSGSPSPWGGGSRGASTSGAGGVYYVEEEGCLLDGMVQTGGVPTWNAAHP